jgi:sarcosine oxidase subunit beta
MRSAEIVIVGAGVVGASVAYHLAKRGCHNVLVLDRFGTPGQGSTGKATGGYRAQFGSVVNVRLSLLSRQHLVAFRDETGVDPGYDPVGYLFLATRAEQLDGLRAALELQSRAGLHESREVSTTEIAALNPHIATGDVLGGSFCPSDGFIEPLQILRGYIAAAERLGVRFEYDAGWVEPRPIGDSRREIVGVQTAKESIATRCLVNAAGAWAARLTRALDVSLPVQPSRRQVAVTEVCDVGNDRMPMTIDVEDGFHFRARDGRLLLLRPDPPAAGGDPFDIQVDDAWVREVAQRAVTRLPRLRDVRIDRAACRAGLYEMTPDHHPVLGAAPGVQGFYLANGFSGHGVMHAPAAGQILAEIILDGEARSLDVRELRASRFAEGKLVQSHDVL